MSYRWLLPTVVCGLLLLLSEAAAQSARDRRDQSSDKQLQARLEKAEETLLRELTEIADEFQKQGQREAALQVLEKIERLDPSATWPKERRQALQDELLSRNAFTAEIDTARGWGSPLAEVEGGKPFRIAASGEYRFNWNTLIPVTGLPREDPGRDYVAEVPFGALMGLIVTDGKPGTPFPVNAELETTPKKSGVLFLRVNTPMAAKCTGTLKVQLSGNLKALTARR